MSDIADSLWLTIEVLCNIVEVLVNSFIKMAAQLYSIKPVPKVRVRLNRKKLHFDFSTDSASESVDARIEKIESARDSLADAFVLGVLASTIASVIYEHIVKKLF